MTSVMPQTVMETVTETESTIDKLKNSITPPAIRSLAAFVFDAANRQLLNASFAVALTILFVKLAAVLKEMIVAWRFGISDDLDAFTVALIVPFSLISIVAAAFQSAFIPVYVRVQELEGTEAAQSLISNALTLIIALFSLALILMLLAAPIYLHYLAPAFGEQKYALTLKLTGIIAPILIFSGISNIFGAVLNAKNSFVAVSLTPLITTVLIVTALWFAARIEALAMAVKLGAMCEVLWLGWKLRKTGIRFRLGLDIFNVKLKETLRQAGSLMLGNFLLSGVGVISVAIAGSLAAGSVSSFSYASKLIALPNGLLATALGATLVPYFSRLSVQSEWQQMRTTLHRFLQLAFLLTLPIAIIFMVFPQFITRQLFQRGAFAENDVATVSTVLFCFALQLPFYVGGVLSARLLQALQSNHDLLKVSAASLLVNIVLTLILSNLFDVAGIALAVSLTYWFSFFALYFLARRRINLAECA